MPIEFQPPQANLNYQIPPPQSTDPLQTLAQMGQLRTQGLQQQQAGMQLEQERMKLDSSKALMDAMVKGGGDFDQTFKLASQPGSKVMPADLIGLRQHYNQMQQEAANLEKTQRENTGAGIDQYRGLLANVQTPDDLAAANAKADQLGIPKTVPRHMQFSDPAHVQAFSNGLATQAQLLKEATERETQAKEKAQTGLAGVQTTEAQQKVDVGERASAIAELQAAPVDPATGSPTPAAVAQIQARHPKVILPPEISTKEGFDRFVRSAVPAEKQPEYDLNKIKSDFGLLGNSEFDQYQLRYAQSIGKKPNQLTFAETQKVLQQYAKDKQTPELLEAILSLKASQGTLAKAQVAALPSDEELEAEARDYRNLDMPPSRVAAMREGRIQYFPQLLAKARAQAAAEGKPFNPAALEARYDTWQNTETKFATGPEAQMVRSFDNLMSHVGLMDEARKALSKSDLPALKTIAGALGVQSGSTAETTYDTIADFVAAEAGKAFLPSGGGESERAKNASHFDRNLGDAQIAKNTKTLMFLADAQREGLERQYERGTSGKGFQKGELFSPDALATRDRLMGKKTAAASSGKITVHASDGKDHPFDTEAQAAAFESAVKAAGGTTSRK